MTWTVQVRTDDTEPWRDAFNGTVGKALTCYLDSPEPKRMLRKGRVIRMTTPPEQLDLFQEES